MNSEPDFTRRDSGGRPRSSLVVSLLLVSFLIITLALWEFFKTPGPDSEPAIRAIQSESSANPDSRLEHESRRFLYYSKTTRSSNAAPPFAVSDPAKPSDPVQVLQTEVADPESKEIQESTRVARSVSGIPLATLAGTVFLKGIPPPEVAIPALEDPSCAVVLAGKPPVTTRFYLVGQNQELADTLVHVVQVIEPRSQQMQAWSPPPVPAEPLLLAQIGCQFEPYVFGIRAGQSLLVRNSDPHLHNLRVSPGAPGHPEINQPMIGQGDPIPLRFDQAEIFLRIGCDIHPWMFAYAAVMPHAWFAVTGANGAYRIEGLPEGRYWVEAFHRKAGKMRSQIAIEAGRAARLDFVMDLASSPAAQPPSY